MTSRDDGPTIVGVDVGGTKVSVAALRDGTFAAPRLQPTAHTSTELFVAEVVASVRAAAAGEGDLAAVGIGVPSVVEFATGRVRTTVNIPVLQDVPLRALLEDELGVPVFVDNDATVAALAEAHDERGELETGCLVMITVGTGIGGGIVIGGRPYRGATGAAGELGHTLIGIEHAIPSATPHFPQPGSFEALAAGHALDGLAREAAATHADSALGERLRETGAVSGVDVVAAAQAGDRVAVELLALLGRRLGIGIANAINTFDPDVVAISGGVSTAGELLLTPAREIAWQYVRDGVGTQTEIRLAKSGPQAGVRGAALLARSELEAHHDHSKERR